MYLFHSDTSWSHLSTINKWKNQEKKNQSLVTSKESNFKRGTNLHPRKPGNNYWELKTMKEQTLNKKWSSCCCTLRKADRTLLRAGAKSKFWEAIVLSSSLTPSILGLFRAMVIATLRLLLGGETGTSGRNLGRRVTGLWNFRRKVEYSGR